MRLTIQQIETYRQCPRKYKFHYVDNLSEQFSTNNACQSLDENIHRTLRDFYRVEDRTIDKLEQLFYKNWMRRNFASQEEENDYKENGIDMLRKFYNNTDCSVNPLYVDLFFQTKIGDIDISGRIDRVDDEGEEIIDYRTESRILSQKELDDSFELSFYGLGLKEKYNLYIKNYSFYYLATNKKITTTRTENQLHTCRLILSNIIKKIVDDKEFITNCGDWCNKCDYNIVCQDESLVKKLYLLSKTTQELSSVFWWDELTRMACIKAFVNLTGAKHGELFLLDEQTRILNLAASVGLKPHEMLKQVQHDTFKIGEDDVGLAAKNGLLYIKKDAAIIPLKTKGRVKGVVKLCGSFSNDSYPILQNVAIQSATALENARLYKEFLAKQNLEQQMKLAAKIQQDLLLKQLPTVTGFEFAAKTIPAVDVGGDYYDFIPLDENMMALVIADVSGKGIPAALIMVMFRTLLRSHAQSVYSAADTITIIDKFITQDLGLFMFITLFYGILDIKKMELRYVNAAHTPAILLHGSDYQLLTTTDSAVGISQPPYTEKTVQLNPNDILLLYTDGVSEINREASDIDYLKRILTEKRTLIANELVDEIIDKRLQLGKQNDDITLMVMKCLKTN